MKVRFLFILDGRIIKQAVLSKFKVSSLAINQTQVSNVCSNFFLIV